ncbi:hypothetical protein TWF694_007784 [Orbilia ellipsospora]|uniref:Uncharacterized protein n=1 Tax=Orbilia ellipsospora TaxID=2528407 RepID=A0AAV9XQE8_9PEZI
MANGHRGAAERLLLWVSYQAEELLCANNKCAYTIAPGCGAYYGKLRCNLNEFLRYLWHPRSYRNRFGKFIRETEADRPKYVNVYKFSSGYKGLDLLVFFFNQIVTYRTPGTTWDDKLVRNLDYKRAMPGVGDYAELLARATEPISRLRPYMLKLEEDVMAELREKEVNKYKATWRTHFPAGSEQDLEKAIGQMSSTFDKKVGQELNREIMLRFPREVNAYEGGIHLAKTVEFLRTSNRERYRLGQAYDNGKMDLLTEVQQTMADDDKARLTLEKRIEWNPIKGMGPVMGEFLDLDMTVAKYKLRGGQLSETELRGKFKAVHMQLLQTSPDYRSHFRTMSAATVAREAVSCTGFNLQVEKRKRMF